MQSPTGAAETLEDYGGEDFESRGGFPILNVIRPPQRSEVLEKLLKEL